MIRRKARIARNDYTIAVTLNIIIFAIVFISHAIISYIQSELSSRAAQTYRIANANLQLYDIYFRVFIIVLAINSVAARKAENSRFAIRDSLYVIVFYSFIVVISLKFIPPIFVL